MQCTFFTASAVPTSGVCVKQRGDVVAYEDDLRLCAFRNGSSWRINRCCSGVSMARGIQRRTHWCSLCLCAYVVCPSARDVRSQHRRGIAERGARYPERDAALPRSLPRGIPSLHLIVLEDILLFVIQD